MKKSDKDEWKIVKLPGGGFIRRPPKKQESSVTNEVFPKYLFRKGERWTHVDKFGNIWYEEIKTR